jgi:hypothetical protein
MTQKTIPPANSIKAFADQKLASDISAIHKALVIDVEVRKIPESTFVKEILPVLTNEAISTDFPLLMAGVAGGPFSEVDIIDEAGNTLFRLPSLLERNIISHKEASRRGSMESMLITADQIRQMSPQRAQHYLAHEFNGRGIAKNRDEIYKARYERLKAILARYGKDLHLDGNVTDLKAGSSNTPSKGKKDLPPLDLSDGDLL